MMAAGFLTSLLQKSRSGMNASVAEKVVRDWQIAKAKALGREHDIHKLSEVSPCTHTHIHPQLL